MSQVPLNPEVEDPEAFRKEEQERIDTAEPLTEEETAEKERLLQEVARTICMDCVTHVSCVQGFSDWSRRDFNQFVRMCGEYGREDLDSICKEVEGKTEEEVWFE